MISQSLFNNKYKGANNAFCSPLDLICLVCILKFGHHQCKYRYCQAGKANKLQLKMFHKMQKNAQYKGKLKQLKYSSFYFTKHPKCLNQQQTQ